MKNLPICQEAVSLVEPRGKKIITTSLIVAERFRKRHDNVIQKIENLIKSDTSNHLNFQVVDYVDSKGEERKKYEMDRKSFSILCMGFNGKKALQWKIDFYNAFELMERELLRRQSASFQQARLNGKTCRRSFTDAVQVFVEYAESNGSRNAHRYYRLFTKLVYRELFETNAVPDNFRDTMSERALNRLMGIEDLIAEWIVDETDKCSDYHDVYKNVKDRLKRYVDVTGPLFPVVQIAA